MDEFVLLYALAAGMVVALTAGVMGCFVVWRRMAYFGDSLGHSALLGIALGLMAGLGTNIGIIIVCSIFAMLLLWLQQKRVLANDTLLGILAHASLAIGIVAMSLLGHDGDLHSYLFGDIFTVTLRELGWIYAGCGVVLLLLILNWSSLILMTIHEDLAMVEGVRTFFMHILLMFLMTLVVTMSISIVGILLITSMLIIPAATARQMAHSPEAMAVLASVIGMLAVVGGVYGSLRWGTPSGPSIVAVSAGLFALLFPLATLFLKRA